MMSIQGAPLEIYDNPQIYDEYNSNISKYNDATLLSTDSNIPLVKKKEQSYNDYSFFSREGFHGGGGGGHGGGYGGG